MNRANHLGARLEAFVFLAVSLLLLAAHAREVRWPVFAGLFVAIDLVGYVPGAIAHRRGESSRLWHTLYNVTHSFVATGLVAVVWSLIHGPEWALLAFPIHLMGDRALFGNFFKAFSEPFELDRRVLA